MKILFAEDTEFWVEQFKPQLEELGEVTFVDNGHGARKAIQEETFDLIVCDHYMPRSTGDEVYNDARQLERSKNKETTYILFSSGPDMTRYRGIEEDVKAHVVLKDYGTDLKDMVLYIKESELPPK